MDYNNEPNDARSLFFSLRDLREKARLLLRGFSEYMNEDEFVEQSQIDELSRCLEDIINKQNELGKIDRLKEAVAEKSCQQIAVEIAKWEDELGKNNLQNILLRLKYLECVAGSESEKKFSEPLRKQVEIFLNRRDKIPLSKWLKEGQKFERLVKVVVDPMNANYDDFSQITKDFGDRVSFLFMRGMIRIPDEVPAESEETISDDSEDGYIDTAEVDEKLSTIVTNFLDHIELSKFVVDKDKLNFELGEHKKDFSVTKLKKKLTSVSIAGNNVIKKLLEDLCLRNVTSPSLFIEAHKVNNANAENKKRRTISVQKVLETLFNFGYVNIGNWNEQLQFYYPNNADRVFLSKVHGNLDLPKIDNDESENLNDIQPESDVIFAFRRYLLALAVCEITGTTIAEHITVTVDYCGDSAIANYQLPSNYVFYFFNLTLANEDCSDAVLRFFKSLKNDLPRRKDKSKIIGLFLVTDKSFEETKIFVNMFKKLMDLVSEEVNIPVRLICFNSDFHSTVFDATGKVSKNWKSEQSESVDTDDYDEIDDDEDEEDDDDEIDLSSYDDERILKLAATALKNSHNAQAVIALSLLSEDTRLKLGFEFNGDYSKINFDAELISMLSEAAKNVGQDVENILQLAFANVSTGKTSAKSDNPTTNFLDNSIEKAIEALDQLESADIDDNSIDFVQALIYSAKNRLNEDELPSNKKFYDECLLGGKYLELSSKGLPLVFENRTTAIRLKQHLRSLDEFETVKYGAQESYRVALKNYDYGILKLLVSRFSEELQEEIQNYDKISESMSKRIGSLFETDKTKFLGQIELAYDRGIISDLEQRTACRSFVTKSYGHFYKTQNEGMFRDMFKKRAADILDKLTPVDATNDAYILKNKTLDKFLHEYGNLFRICTEEQSRAVEVKEAFARFDNMETLEFDEIKFEIHKMNRALPLIERRDLAREYKLDSRYRNVLLVDQVVAMYLSRFSGKEFELKLMQVLLPFSNFIPKTVTGSESFLNLGFIVSQTLFESVHDRSSSLKPILNICYKKLIEAIAENYRQGNFKKSDTPPYKIDDNFLTVMMADGKYNDAIDDGYRKIIKEEDAELAMRAMCLLRFRQFKQDDQSEEFKIRSYEFTATLKDVENVFEEFALSDRKLKEQLQKLTTLGILAMNDDKEYYFTQKKFWGLGGGEAEIEGFLYQQALEANEHG